MYDFDINFLEVGYETFLCRAVSMAISCSGHQVPRQVIKDAISGSCASYTSSKPTL